MRNKQRAQSFEAQRTAAQQRVTINIDVADYYVARAYCTHLMNRQIVAHVLSESANHNAVRITTTLQLAQHALAIFDEVTRTEMK